MKSYGLRQYGLALVIWLLFVAVAPAPLGAAGDKLKPEEIVAKHLEAVGAAETRGSITTRIISGTAVVTFRSPGTGQVTGPAVLASDGQKNLLGMTFGTSNNNYPQEKLGFDGNNVTASYLRPGVRSPLGNFLLTHKEVVKQGLIGGALSQAWPLYDLAGKKPKLESAGTKKVGDRQAYALKYLTRGGSDLSVTLYFDAETFQHIRTEYTRTVVAQIGSNAETSAQQSETRYRMVEDFSDFRKESGLTLPHKYKISLEETTGTGGTFKADWDIDLTQFAFNQRIDPNSFNVEK